MPESLPPKAMRACSLLLSVVFAGSACSTPPPPASAPRPAAPPGGEAVSARGRLEPAGRVIRIAGPSDFVVVVEELRVAEGDDVKAGDVLAKMDTWTARHARAASLKAQLGAQEAAFVRLEAELANSVLEQRRSERLSRVGE